MAMIGSIAYSLIIYYAKTSMFWINKQVDLDQVTSGDFTVEIGNIAKAHAEWVKTKDEKHGSFNDHFENEI